MYLTFPFYRRPRPHGYIAIPVATVIVAVLTTLYCYLIFYSYHFIFPFHYSVCVSVRLYVRHIILNYTLWSLVRYTPPNNRFRLNPSLATFLFLPPETTNYTHTYSQADLAGRSCFPLITQLSQFETAFKSAPRLGFESTLRRRWSLPLTSGILWHTSKQRGWLLLAVLVRWRRIQLPCDDFVSALQSLATP